jgi:5'-methylthioadenosine phosphorylase
MKQTAREIPHALKAFIGGSSTYSVSVPEDLNLEGVKKTEEAVFTTPFGDSPPFTVFEIDGEKVLTVKMHGWRPGVKRADASRQVFWVLRQAGVVSILAEGGVGTVNQDFPLRHFIIPGDYIDLSMRKDVSLTDNYLLIMRDPVCQYLAEILSGEATRLFPDKSVNSGVYAVTDGRHFESKAEVRMIKTLGGDVVGQSLCPEVYLAREIGACYAGIYLIVNRAEGVGDDWSHAELKDIFHEEAFNVGRIIIESLRKVSTDRKSSCVCASLRKKTLLRAE